MMDAIVFISVCMLMMPLLSVDCVKSKRGFLAHDTDHDYADDDNLIHVAKIGDRVVLPCYDPESNGQPIRWFKGNLMLSYGKTVIRDKAKFEIESPAPKETNLAIKDVEQTEEGVYRCKTTVNGREIVIGERLLKVEGADEPYMYLEEIASPVTVTVVAGQPVILSCNVRNLGDKYKVVWTGPKSMILSIATVLFTADSRFSVERSTVSNWNLMIREVDKADQGNYTCQITTDPVKSKVVTLQVEEPASTAMESTTNAMTVLKESAKEESGSSGSGAIFIEANSSVYIRDGLWGYNYYKLVTTDLYVNPRNFDMVIVEDQRPNTNDCPSDLTECYVLRLRRYGGSGRQSNKEIDLAFSHIDEFNKAREICN